MGKGVPQRGDHRRARGRQRVRARRGGETRHRGASFRSDMERSERRRSASSASGPTQGTCPTNLPVWSAVPFERREGFLYFIGRRDEMIKTSGYRVSNTEIEEVVFTLGLGRRGRCLGVEHPTLGQAIVLVAKPAHGRQPDSKALLDACKTELPTFMLPQRIDWVDAALPRNANGKIDRKALASQRLELFASPGRQA